MDRQELDESLSKKQRLPAGLTGFVVVKDFVRGVFLPTKESNLSLLTCL